MRDVRYPLPTSHIELRTRGDSLRMTDTNTAPALNITDVVLDEPIAPRVLNAAWPNVIHTQIADIVKERGPAPWSHRVIADERNLVTLIATAPGGGNRPHWHRDFDEWWVVMAGQLEWELTGGTVLRGEKDEH